MTLPSSYRQYVACHCDLDPILTSDQERLPAGGSPLGEGDGMTESRRLQAAWIKRIQEDHLLSMNSRLLSPPEEDDPPTADWQKTDPVARTDDVDVKEQPWTNSACSTR